MGKGYNTVEAVPITFPARIFMAMAVPAPMLKDPVWIAIGII